MANINYLVAPYEADAQLAYLCRANIVKTVISEDSDLLAYGCPRVLFKIDTSGEAQEIELCDYVKISSLYCMSDSVHNHNSVSNHSTLDSTSSFLHNCNEDNKENHRLIVNDSTCINSRQTSTLFTKGTVRNKPILSESITAFDWTMFVTMCVLAGCDYTKNAHISGLGIRTAFNLALEFKTLDRAFHHMATDSQLSERFFKVKSDQIQESKESDREIINYDHDKLKAILNKSSDMSWTERLISHIIAALVFFHHHVYDLRHHKIVPMYSSDIKESDMQCKAGNADLIQYGKYRFPASALIGPAELDSQKLYLHVTKGHLKIGFDLNAMSGIYEKDAIAYIEKKTREIKDDNSTSWFNVTESHLESTSSAQKATKGPTIVNIPQKVVLRPPSDVQGTKMHLPSRQHSQDSDNIKKFVAAQLESLSMKKQQSHNRRVSLEDAFHINKKRQFTNYGSANKSLTLLSSPNVPGDMELGEDDSKLDFMSLVVDHSSHEKNKHSWSHIFKSIKEPKF